MRIRQGDIFFADLDPPQGSGPGDPHFVLIVQNDELNQSNIATVMVCMLTTNLKRGGNPGNVTLVPGEANLEEQSVINVSQMTAVDKRVLRYKKGWLDSERMREVWDGQKTRRRNEKWTSPRASRGGTHETRFIHRIGDRGNGSDYLGHCVVQAFGRHLLDFR